MNTLYYGDNLNILRRYIKDQSVDLVFFDPPFNSNCNYNVLFKNESGLEADSLEWLSADTWHWKGAASTYDDLIMTGDKVSEMLQASALLHRRKPDDGLSRADGRHSNLGSATAAERSFCKGDRSRISSF